MAIGTNPSGITKADRKVCFLYFRLKWKEMASFYILFSEKLNKYYLGACSNMDRRLYEHNIGHSKFTAAGVPWKLVYEEHFEELVEAKRRESQLKKMKSRKYIEFLISSFG